MTRRFLSWAALSAVVAGALLFAAVSGDSDPSPEARSRRLAAELRCPVCQGLSVADSPSPTARAIAEDIRRRVKAGQSDAEIRGAYVARYGEWVLLSPTGSGVSAMVWALPVAVVVLAAGGLALAFWRWRREPALTASEADRALVEAERARGRLEQAT